MPSRRLQDTFFYTLEKSIKSYRQFAQAEVNAARIDLTIDQWLILKTLQENPDVTQQEIASIVFKDFASITRIIQLLVGRKFLRRARHPNDGRRSALALTKTGETAIRALEPVIRRNRRRALGGIAAADASRMQELLVNIVANCQRRQIND